LSENAASWPRLLIVAGPNGSGKTTLTNRLRAMGLELGEYINADEIALELPPGLERDRTAQIEAERRRALALRENRSFSFETVMSHPSKIDEMRAARTAGYNITFIGVALQNPQLNVARVALRVSEGGHDVPKDRVLGRYPRVLALMPDAISLADRSLIFDNSDSSQGPILGLVASRRMLDATPRIEVQVAASVALNQQHWIMRHLVTGLSRLRNQKQIKLAVRWNFKG
jgi:predicted ABC-type ATPase